VCYSAQIWQNYRKYVRVWGADIGIKEFMRLYWDRQVNAKMKIPKGMDAAFSDPQSDDERKIKALIDEFDGQQVAKLRFAVPVIKRKIELSSSGQYMASRETRDGSSSVRPVLLLDATATTNRLFKRFDVSFGVRNLLNRVYSDPTAIAVDSMRQDGRSVFLKLVWRPVE